MRATTCISFTARVKPGFSPTLGGPGDARYPSLVEDRPDIALVTGPTEDGEGVRVVRFRDEAVSVGEVRPLQEGKPLAAGAEIVRLKPRSGCDVPAFDVEPIYKHIAEPTRATKGPANVSSSAYRSNWETIFGAPSSIDGAAPN